MIAYAYDLCYSTLLLQVLKNQSSAPMELHNAYIYEHSLLHKTNVIVCVAQGRHP